MAAWHSIPPESVIIPANFVNFGVHPVSVYLVTKISFFSNLSISSILLVLLFTFYYLLLTELVSIIKLSIKQSSSFNNYSESD